MNVIVLVADSLRVDHVGCYGRLGGGRSQADTPNLDRLASESALLQQAYAENLPTLPCRTAWWTGRHLFTQRGWQPFAPSDYLLAEVLWDKGYTSALITDVYHMHKPVYNCGRGFDTVRWIRGQEYDPWKLGPDDTDVDLSPVHRLRGDESDPLWRARFGQYLRNVSWYQGENDYSIARVVQAAIGWLEEVTQRQKDHLFLWVDCFDPHEPWDPPSPYREMYDPDYRGQELIDPVPGPVEGYMTAQELHHTKALYAGEVTFVDKWLGVLLDRIRDLGLYENSLIMFTSDHGEPFGEHGIVRKAQPWGYEELAHIPWLIRHPEGLGAGMQISGFVQPPDMMPTILDALGLGEELELAFTAPVRLTFPQDVVIDRRTVQLHGHSLLPLLCGDGGSARDFAVTTHYGRQWAIRTQEWTYLLNLDGRPAELYHRSTDLQEQHEVASDHPEVADGLELTLRRFADEISRKF
jgi:arylsulfatase A-like enzyme